MKTIYRINSHTILESEKQAKYLSEMHKKGWKLIFYAFPCFYIFQECEPEEVIYQIDFNEAASQSKEEYVKMFEDASWEYLQTTMDFSFFKKPLSQMDEEEHIFNDEQSIKDMNNRFKTSKTFPKLLLGTFLLGLTLIMLLFTNGFFLLAAICFSIIALMPLIRKFIRLIYSTR